MRLASVLPERLRRRLRPTPVERRVQALELGGGDLAIDCGANVGEVTVALARTGAHVHAFEPNPYAFQVLSRRVAGRPNVTLHRCAVLDRDGPVRLFLHERAGEDQIAWSRGSSTLAFKGNVDPSAWIDVDGIDLARFVLELARPVSLLKLDVEGAEVPIIDRLLETGAIGRVATVLVELHDRHVPELQAESDRLRRQIEQAGLGDRIVTDWH